MKRFVIGPRSFVMNGVVLAFLIGSLFGITQAQATRSLDSAARRIEEFNKQGANATRDQMQNEIGRRKPSAEELRQTKIINTQIEEDLTSLQSGYNEIVSKLQSRETMSEDFVSRNAERIHKHSSRLRGLIKFPELKEEKAGELSGPPTSQPSTRKQLIELCSQILAFFDSPLFANPTVLDVPKADATRQVLDDIIQRSSKLKTPAN